MYTYIYIYIYSIPSTDFGTLSPRDKSKMDPAVLTLRPPETVQIMGKEALAESVEYKPTTLPLGPSPPSLVAPPTLPDMGKTTKRAEKETRQSGMS